MKVVLSDEVDKVKLSKHEKEKVAILKLTREGQYVENVGIRDGKYLLITEDERDEVYLAQYVGLIAQPPMTNLTQEHMAKWVQFLIVSNNIKEQKDKLNGVNT